MQPERTPVERPLDDETVAELCHELNRYWCEMLGDHHLNAWFATDKAHRDSVIAGVRYRKLNPDSTPEEQHDAWRHHKLAEGWTYGPVKSDRLKLHPNLVDYNDLPFEQRFKDYLFRAVVAAAVEAEEDDNG